jgi:hypothetical protein
LTEKPTTLFQVLSTGRVRAELTLFYALMAKQHTNVSVFLGHSGYIATDRNAAVNTWLKTGEDVLIQCDEDMVPPMNVLELVDSMGDYDIMSTVYLCGSDSGPMVAAKSFNKTCHCGGKNEGCSQCAGEGIFAPRVYPPNEGDPYIIPVEWVGTGCYAIKRSAAEAMKEKYGKVFDVDFAEDGSKRTGTDVFMCKQAREIGLKIGINRQMVCGHAKGSTWVPARDNVGIVMPPWGTYWLNDNVPTCAAQRRSVDDIMKEVAARRINKAVAEIVEYEPVVQKPLSDVANPKDTLMTGLEVLNKLGLKHWVSAGTLLGLHRDGGFIADDTDIDIGVHSTTNNDFGPCGEAIARAFPKRFRLLRTISFFGRVMQLAFVDSEQDDVIFDLYFYYERFPVKGVDVATELVNVNSATPILKKPKALVEDIEMWESPIGVVPAPKDRDAYCEWRYGAEWRTPAQKKGVYNGDF